ncbi:MAG: GlsB/YeaQ/YmgE family stress response membrane protein [Anaerolineales bacterium]
MAIIALIVLAVIVILAVLVWLTASLFGLAITVIVAGVIGWAADQITPGELPYGVIGAVGAGLLGALLGGLLLDGFGPDLAGLAIIPTLVGAVILAFAAELLGIGKRKSAATLDNTRPRR